MNFSCHRHTALFGLPALALLMAATGCSSADDGASAVVPSPDAKVTELCQNLDKVLPKKIDGLDRNDPEPRSALTAGWGSPAIILRCGVERPAKMSDENALSGEVNGVGWLMENQGDGSYRFTSGLRRAYVEVSVPTKWVQRDGSGSLVDLAAPIKKAIPEGIAD
ncbi:DUF3515 domain-containing protein [Streptomyces sp. NBC_01549]|uniref:DUF3515 domain-containing protein n=1 Tax=Streptomyces sp. NBC_01549 TaxID=2975874 RepID=UPI002250EAE2|nr:DUF3515 domain-containing protein [Streptomyces sp. NBC_01549]MCX4588993.1 DUF3515 domain-containing protein [Streptomyces sp. NBC_01549]